MNEFLIERNLVNAKAIKTKVDKRLGELSVYDPKIAQWFMKRYTDWLQNDYQGVQRLTSAEDWSRLMGTEPPDWYVAKLGQEEMLYADLDADVLREIEAKLAEFFASLKGSPLYQNDKRLLAITVPQALQGWDLLQRHLKRKAEKESVKTAAREGMNDATEHVMDFPDGSFVIEFRSTSTPGASDQPLRQALAAETKMMRNLCVGIFDDTTNLTGGQGEIYAGGIESGTKRIFSIRDESGQSHVDVEAAVDEDSHGWAIRQVKGPANQTPSPKWTPHVKTLLNDLKLPPNTMGRADIKNLYLSFDRGQYRDVEDMAEPMGKSNPDGTVWYRIGSDPRVYHLRQNGQTLATVHAMLASVSNITGPSPGSRPARDYWQTIIMLIRREGLTLRHASEKVGMVYTGESRRRSGKPLAEQILLERNLINAGGIKTRVNQTLRDLGITDPKISLWFKKRYADWLQNDYQGVEQLHTADDWNRLMRSPAPDWFTAKIGQDEMLYADFDNAELREIEGKLAEYLATLIGTPIHDDEQRLLRITVPQALDAWEQQHRQMQRQNQRAMRKMAAQESMNDATHVVMEFDDGAFVVEFKPTQEGGGHDRVLRQALQAETQMMDGICVGMFSDTSGLTGSHGETYADGVERGTMRIFSIRDPEGRSHVTIEASESGGTWHIRQVKGPANQAPGPKWIKHIKTLLNALKVPPDSYGQRDIAKLHLDFSQDGRYGGIEDVADPIGEAYPDGSVWYRTGSDYQRNYHLRLDGATLATVDTTSQSDVRRINGPTPNSRPARTTWTAIRDLIRSQKLVVVDDGEKIGMVYVGDVWLDLDNSEQNYQPVEVPLPKGWSTVLLDINGQSRLFILRHGKTTAAAMRAEGNRVVKISLMDETSDAVRQHLLTIVRHLSLRVTVDGGLLGMAVVNRNYVDLYDPNLAGEAVAHPAAGTVVLEIPVENNLLYLFRRNREPLCGLLVNTTGGDASGRDITKAFSVGQTKHERVTEQTLDPLKPEHRDLLNAFLLPRLDRFFTGKSQYGSGPAEALMWREISGLPVAMPIDHPDLPGEVVARTQKLKILKCRFGDTFDVYLARDPQSRTVASMAVISGDVKRVAGYTDKGSELPQVSPDVSAHFQKIVKQEGFAVKYDTNAFNWTEMSDKSYVDLMDPDLPGKAIAHYGKIEVFQPSLLGKGNRIYYLFRTTPKPQVVALIRTNYDGDIWDVGERDEGPHSTVLDRKLWPVVRNFVIDHKLVFQHDHKAVGLTDLEGIIVDPLEITGEQTDDLGDGWTVRAWDGQTPYRSKNDYRAKPQTIWIIQQDGRNVAFLWGTKKHQIKEIRVVSGDKVSGTLRKKIDAFATLHDFEVTKAGHEHLGYVQLGGGYEEAASYRNAGHAVAKGKAQALQSFLVNHHILNNYPMDAKALKFLKGGHSPEVETVIFQTVDDMIRRGLMTTADPLGLHRVFRPETAAAFLNAVDPRQGLLSPDTRKILAAEARKAIRQAISKMDSEGVVYGQYKDYFGPLFKSGHVDKTVARMLGQFGIAADNLPWEPGENFAGRVLTTIQGLERGDVIDDNFSDSSDNDGLRMIGAQPIRADDLTDISNSLESYVHGGVLTDRQFAQAQKDLLASLDKAMEDCYFVCFETPDDKTQFEEFLTWLGQDPEEWMSDHASGLTKRGREVIDQQKEDEIKNYELNDDSRVNEKLNELVDANEDDLEREAVNLMVARYEEEWNAEHEDEEFDPLSHPEWESVLDEVKEAFMDEKRDEVEEEVRLDDAKDYVSDMASDANYMVENQFQVLGK